LISGLAVLHAWQFHWTSIDDAYITYRYADNIAHGLGYVFNPGQRVEGTSTFLFTLLLAIPGLLGLNIEWVARCLGIGSLAALVCVVFNYVRTTVHARSSHWLAAATVLMIASSTSLAFHAALGMELLLYIALLTAGVLGHLRNARDAAQCRYWMLWLALAGATRTEAFFVAFAVLGCIAMEHAVSVIKTRTARAAAMRIALQALTKPAVQLAAILVPLLAFRWYYFGTWVPNSVTAKSGFFDEILRLPWAAAYERISMEQGAKMLAQFGTERLGYLVFLVPLGWFCTRHRRQTSIFIVVGAILAAVVIWNNGDWMPHARLLAPFIPLLAVLMATSIAQIGVWVGKRAANSIQLMLALAVFGYGINLTFYERTFTRTSNPVADYMIELGKALHTAHVDSEVLATDMAGRVPYFSGIRTIDMFGLCDTYIAHHGKPVLHMGKTDYPYVYRKQPDYYFYNYAFSVRGMMVSRDFRAYANDYWVVMTPFAARPANQGGKVLLARKNLPRLAELVTRLNARLVDPKVL
jgi:hypothetical protein